MTFKVDDRIYETSTTTGTGAYTLDGAVAGFQSFSVLGANNYCPYFATDGTNWEAGIGQVLTSPSRLARDTVLSSSNGDAAVDWAAGTRALRCGPVAFLDLPRTKSKSVAGSSNVTLTQDEQRCSVLTLTGELTGNIDVIIDATPWFWPIVYNNTSGAFTLTFKVSGQTGVVLPQGLRSAVACNGTDAVALLNKWILTPPITSATLIAGVDGAVYTLPGQTADIGYKNIPQNSQSGAYALVLLDSGKHILHPSADISARTFTIPANSSVAFPIGTAITFVNQNGAGVVTIAITTDTMRLAGPGTTGSRTLAANGVATALKITSTEWIISGTGLT